MLYMFMDLHRISVAYDINIYFKIVVRVPSKFSKYETSPIEIRSNLLLCLVGFRCFRALEVLEHEYCYLKNKLHEYFQVMYITTILHKFP